MSEQHYLYWHPGLPKPKYSPEGCETLITGNWYLNAKAPAEWDFPRRWPVSEHVWRAHHYCLAYGITVPEGYEVIGFDAPRYEQEYLDGFGRVYHAAHGHFAPAPILCKIEQPN